MLAKVSAAVYPVIADILDDAGCGKRGAEIATDIARAAIMAMRDYTEAMSLAAGEVPRFASDVGGEGIGQSAGERAYLAALDAAPPSNQEAPNG